MSLSEDEQLRHALEASLERLQMRVCALAATDPERALTLTFALEDTLDLVEHSDFTDEEALAVLDEALARRRADS